MSQGTDRLSNGVSRRVSSNIYSKVMNSGVAERTMRNVARRDNYPKGSCVWMRDGSRPLFPHGASPPGSGPFPRLAHGTCSLELPGPGYSQAPPNSDRPSELPDLHGQTAWAPPALAVQLGCWGQRHQPDKQPGERNLGVRNKGYPSGRIQ